MDVKLGSPHPPIKKDECVSEPCSEFLDHGQSLMNTAPKKRRRKEWVYKSEYNKLEFELWIMRYAALVGWLAFFITMILLFGV